MNTDIPGTETPRFGVIIIGDEILSGKRQDAHLSQAIAILKTRGLALAWAEYLGDDPQQIAAVSSAVRGRPPG